MMVAVEYKAASEKGCTADSLVKDIVYGLAVNTEMRLPSRKKQILAGFASICLVDVADMDTRP